MNDKDPTFSGRVTELNAFSWTANSAQLEFTIAPPKGAAKTFVMEDDITPQVFAAAATILMNALQTRMRVEITYAAGTSKAKRVSVTAAKRSA